MVAQQTTSHPLLMRLPHVGVYVKKQNYVSYCGSCDVFLNDNSSLVRQQHSLRSSGFLVE